MYNLSATNKLQGGETHLLEREEREVGGVVDVGRVADAGRHDQERGLRHDDLQPREISSGHFSESTLHMRSNPGEYSR